MLLRRHGTIASAIQEARASLKDPSRPFTPAAMTRNRTLFFDEATTQPESRPTSAMASARGPSKEARHKPQKTKKGRDEEDALKSGAPRRNESKGGAPEDDDDGSPGTASSSSNAGAVLSELMDHLGPEASWREVDEALRKSLKPLVEEEATGRGDRDAVLGLLAAAVDAEKKQTKKKHQEDEAEASSTRARQVAVLKGVVDGRAEAKVLARLCVCREALGLCEASLRGSSALRVAKAVFEASRTPDNDAALLKSGLVPVLVYKLGSSAARLTRDEDVCVEPTVYIAGALKNLTNTEAHLKALGQHGLICILTDLVRACVESVKQATAEKTTMARSHRRKALAQVLVQVTGALRNMCAAEHKAQFDRQLEAAKTASALASTLSPFASYWELTLNVSRALAKLSLHEPTRAQLNAEPQRVVDMFETLIRAHDAASRFYVLRTTEAPDDVAIIEAPHNNNKHPRGDETTTAKSTYPAIVVRLGFILGNLTAGNDRNRRLLGLEAKGVDPLVDMLRTSGQAWLESTRVQGDAAEAKWRPLEHVVIKLIRLAANVSINPKVGARVATTRGVDVLSALLATASDLGREELLLNVVSAMTNLSYYVHEKRKVRDDADPHDRQGRSDAAPSENNSDLTLFDSPRRMCANLLGVLVHSNEEAVSEAARAFGNLSRDSGLRLVMRDEGIDEALVLLLAHPNRDVVFASCGALVNIAADPDTKPVLWQFEAHVQLINVARRAGLTDPSLGAVTCKALHNLLMDVRVGENNALDRAEHVRLQDTLDELVDAAESLLDEDHEAKRHVADDDDNHAETHDFLRAARALLSILDEADPGHHK